VEAAEPRSCNRYAGQERIYLDLRSEGQIDRSRVRLHVGNRQVLPFVVGGLTYKRGMPAGERLSLTLGSVMLDQVGAEFLRGCHCGIGNHFFLLSLLRFVQYRFQIYRPYALVSTIPSVRLHARCNV